MIHAQHTRLRTKSLPHDVCTAQCSPAKPTQCTLNSVGQYDVHMNTVRYWTTSPTHVKYTVLDRRAHIGILYSAGSQDVYTHSAEYLKTLPVIDTMTNAHVRTIIISQVFA